MTLCRLCVRQGLKADYRPMLREYLKFAEKGHEPQSMRAALAMHDTFLKKGDMRLTDFGEYLK